MAVAVQHISKSFPGTRALDDVGLQIREGEVHALAGANGSGKSTLVRVLSGVHQPDSGWIEINGQRLGSIHSPSAAAHLGIRSVHQEAPLIDTLSVAECVALFRGYPVGALSHVRWRNLYQAVERLFEQLEIPVDPRALAGSLSPAARALVSLAIALDGIEASGSRLLVLDEATASLPENEASTFLSRVKGLARRGLPVLLVTHRISEIPEISDVVTVLANGRVVHHGPSATVDEEFIIAKMISGSQTRVEESATRPRTSLQALWEASDQAARPQPGESVALEVTHLRARNVVDISFAVRPGEIVGFTGLSSSGINELPYVLAGALDRSAGRVRLGAFEYPIKMEPRLAVQHGLALVPADRLRQGGIRSLSVRDNIVLPEADRYWRAGTRERAAIAAAIGEFDVQPADPAALFERLSGGNQQKVVLAKWLLTRPRVLVLDDPTSGVDPRSRRLVFHALRAAAAEGIAVILLSNEHEQLLAMCSRILVLRSGVVAAELTGPEMTLEALARWSYT